MKKMKILCSTILSLVLFLALYSPVMAAETTATDNTTELLREYSYYDSELDAYVIAFTRNSDDTINYLTKNEAVQLSIMTENVPIQNNTQRKQECNLYPVMVTVCSCYNQQGEYKTKDSPYNRISLYCHLHCQADHKKDQPYRQ